MGYCVAVPVCMTMQLTETRAHTQTLATGMSPTWWVTPALARELSGTLFSSFSITRVDQAQAASNWKGGVLGLFHSCTCGALGFPPSLRLQASLVRPMNAANYAQGVENIFGSSITQK